MKWCEICVNTNTENADLVADAFFSIGCNGGVKIIDKADIAEIIHSQLMWDYMDEKIFEGVDAVKVSGYVGLEDKDVKIAELTEILDGENISYGEINVSEIDDEAWFETWKKYYSPIEIGRYLVVPQWLNRDADGKVKILLNPGMAFGTGEHESTQMCLQLMSEHSFEGKDVIDVGTGSGILGVAAIKSGAKSCYMCDIDTVAVAAAKANAEVNGVSDLAEIELSDLLTKPKKADIVLANITADVLIKLSVGLPKHINKGGVLICSGIIHCRRDEVIKAFTDAGFELRSQVCKGEWEALEFRWI